MYLSYQFKSSTSCLVYTLNMWNKKKSSYNKLQISNLDLLNYDIVDK